MAEKTVEPDQIPSRYKASRAKEKAEAEQREEYNTHIRDALRRVMGALGPPGQRKEGPQARVDTTDSQQRRQTVEK